MSYYDFRILNDKEFEVLVADLLSEEFKTRIERFKPGRDQGVDGRWFAANGSEIIIQCKHWPRSNAETLLSKLKAVEKPKVDRLKPLRYIFVCSLELSRKNKSDIQSALKPHIRVSSDVFGLEDLQDLLRIHSQVEKRHPKLWLASASVIGTIVNSGIITRSADMLADITARLALYVDTAEAQRAREKLQRQRVLIIKGQPGVGKTTLAEQLVTESVAEGYQLSIIERDIREVENVFDPNQRQVFYFDDFLGRNFLEALDGNKDSHITNFIKRIVLHQNKRFVLTTRTHILDRGKHLSEIFDRERIDAREFELIVGAYSRLEKGKILYSHLWNGSLPEWAIEEFYSEHRYIDIINHDNFNPRIIGFLTSSDRLLAIEPDDFWGFVQSNLDFPEAIWRHVFDQQLSRDTRDLALLVTLNGQSIKQDDLQEAFLRLNSKRSENPVQQRVNFSTALQLGAGSVLKRTINIGYPAAISLFNPSIADYLLRSELEHLIANLVCALRTKASLDYLEALLHEELIQDKTFHQSIQSLADALVIDSDLQGPVAVKIALLLKKMPSADHKFASLVANSLNMDDSSICNAGSIQLFAEELCAGRLTAPDVKFAKVILYLEDMAEDDDLMADICKCAQELDRKDGGCRIESLRVEVVNAWIGNADSLVRNSSTLDEYLDIDAYWEARDQVSDFVRGKFQDMGLIVSEEEIESFVESVDVREIISDNLNSYSRDDYDDRDSRIEVSNPDLEIIEYFDRSSYQ